MMELMRFESEDCNSTDTSVIILSENNESATMEDLMHSTEYLVRLRKALKTFQNNVQELIDEKIEEENTKFSVVEREHKQFLEMVCEAEHVDVNSYLRRN